MPFYNSNISVRCCVDVSNLVGFAQRIPKLWGFRTFSQYFMLSYIVYVFRI